MMAIGVITVVMTVSRLRVTCRMVRPVSTAVSARKYVAIACSLPLAHDREEDVLKGGLLLDVFDLGGRQQLPELGQGAVDDDPPLVEDRDPVGELFCLVQVLRGEQ